jgi:tellurium resistance protein TerD
MTVNLTKGSNVSLTKQAPNLTAVAVGLGWDARSTTGAPFDLDASALATGENKRVLSDGHFVFFNNLKSPEGTIEHMGDELEGGSGDGDDEEVIKIDLAATPPSITNIFFPVSIYGADENGQTFGQVANAYIRIVDQANGKELARYDLSEDASTETAMVFGELYRSDREWKFRAIGQGYASGLGGIVRDYGVNV